MSDHLLNNCQRLSRDATNQLWEYCREASVEMTAMATLAARMETQHATTGALIDMIRLQLLQTSTDAATCRNLLERTQPAPLSSGGPRTPPGDTPTHRAVAQQPTVRGPGQVKETRMHTTTMADPSTPQGSRKSVPGPTSGQRMPSSLRATKGSQLPPRRRPEMETQRHPPSVPETRQEGPQRGGGPPLNESESTHTGSTRNQASKRSPQTQQTHTSYSAAARATVQGPMQRPSPSSSTSEWTIQERRRTRQPSPPPAAHP